MPNYRSSFAKAAAGEDVKDGKLAKGNSELPRSPDDVRSKGLLSSGNISHLSNVTFKLGERGSGTRALATVQDFDVLRKNCLEKGILFEDREFPAQKSSIYGSKMVAKDIKWIRPPGLVTDPQLIVEGVSRFDVKQGQFGDCWLLAATANLATYPNLFAQVVPEGQSFREGHYAGIFHFRFWQYGRWVDVVIDDRLPTYKGKLLGLHSAANNEFWSPLLEKAYAKLHGSYLALEGGDSGDAMEDFTGGVAELYNGDTTPPDLFDILLKAHEKNALMGCSFKKAAKNKKVEADNEAKEEQTEGGEEEEEDDEDNLKGLLEAHAYSITEVKYVAKGTEKNAEKIPLVRVRNPWGTEDEWLGAWSDKSSEWKSISEKDKKELGLKSAADGEFWMCFQDLKDHLSDLEICYLNLNSFVNEPDKKEWHISTFEGEWVRGVTAGGCTNDLTNFQHNPQYRITFKEKSTVIIALMQKNRRIQGKESVNFLSIGFSVFPMNEEPPRKLPKPLDLGFFEDIDEVDFDVCKNKSAPDSHQYSQHRQVSCRVTVIPGSYCVIPSTYAPDEEGEYLLRIFSDKPHEMEEYHEQVGVDAADYSGIEEPKNERLRDYFRLLSGDDWELDWIEQKKLLDFQLYSELHDEGFNQNSCRSMVAMLDIDRSGKLDFSEFKKFWYDVKKLKNVFKRITANTADEVGYLSTYDLRKALNNAGYHVNIHMLGRLVRRYGTEDKKITLEDFIILALRIRTMIGIFKQRAKATTACFTLDEWLDTTLYL